MITINVLEGFKQLKIGQIRHINELIENIKQSNILNNDTDIELNIEGCYTAYPATPKLIDYFLYYLSSLNGKKKIHIKLDGIGNKLVYILYILVLESEFFNIYDKIDNEDDVKLWEKTINEKLKKKNILLKVTFTPTNKDYIYWS
ncbi:MAG: hypothetical protein IPM69_13620 [Ignavibacteria bacterium]|nr:hypothetical protein [Ignavibacteria bacterium]